MKARNSFTSEGLGNKAAPTEREPQSFRSEAELEAAIAAAYQRLITAPTWEEKLERWREMVRLLDKRTPPPSTSARLGHPSAECCSDAAGGVL